MNKFEDEETRAEAKLKLAQLTAQQKKFEERKRQLEEELERRRQEEEEQQRLIDIQLQEQILEQQRIQEEEAMLLQQYEQQQSLDDVDMSIQQDESRLDDVPKKTKKVKKKKKKEKDDPLEESSVPQLKLGFVGFSENKSMFESLRHQDDNDSQIKQVKVNKLDTSSIFQNNVQQKVNKDAPIKVNKLKKNSFIELLEKNSNAEPVIQRKKISESNAKKAEIRFESKKRSVNEPKEEAVEEPVMLRPKVRGSKSIENPLNPKCKKTSSTLSLIFDNTKEFFRNSKEKLFRLSKEALNEIDQIRHEQKEEKPSASEMQNYLLKHVLFDNTEKPQKKAKKVKEKTKKKSDKKDKKLDEDEYLDKDYKEKIEQYCSLVEDTKNISKKDVKLKEEKLPQIKLVDVKSMQEQLQSQFRKNSLKPTQNDELECIKSNKVKEMQEQLFMAEPTTVEPVKTKKPVKVNNSIIDKIKSLEQAEEKRIQRERENEERIQKLLEQEMERALKKKERDRELGLDVDSENEQEEMNESNETDMDEDLKDDIRKRLEEEIENLEEEQRELESTEQMLIEEEKLQNDENEADEEQRETFREIKENLNEKKKQADEHKKVLRRFQNIFDKDDDNLEKKSNKKIGSIHDKIENFLSVSENDKFEKKFEDSVLTGVSDIMSKVKDKFEPQAVENTPMIRRGEVRRKLGQSALFFEQISQEAHEETSTDRQEREWAWKSKSPEELLQNSKAGNATTDNENDNKSKKDIRDLKFEEMLEDINAVKERMRHRNLQDENKAKMEEMNMFMDEIQNSLDELERDNPPSDTSDEDMIAYKRELEARRKKKKKRKSQSIVDNIRKELVNEYVSEKPSIVDSIKKELLTDNTKEKRRDSTTLEDTGVCISHLKKKIIDSYEAPIKQDKQIPQSNTGIVSKISEMLVNDEKGENVELTKGPKILLRTTSIEDDENAPAKTLEELKQEQVKKKWAWKEKDMKDIQNYLKSYDDVIPENLIQNQKNLEELDDEMNVVKAYMPGKDSDLIAQIREEKEREFESFMNNMKSYLDKETKTPKEGNFKKEMKSYLDLIDDKKENIKSYNIPELKTQSLNKLKKQLFDETTNETEKADTPKVSRIPAALIEKIESPKVEITPPKIQSDIGSNQTDSIKSFFEKKQGVKESPVIKPKTIHPSVQSLKASKPETEQSKLENQLKHKLKTINELQNYIENHEQMCVPTIIEAIQNFCISRKDSDRVISYKKFIDLAHSFKDQKARTAEQKVFKDNIRAYLCVIENVDIRVNGTPKLQKHTPVKVEPKSSNNKKNEIEKEKSTTQPLLTPDERRKQILQKYGFKDHVSKNKSIEISSCSDSDDENDDDDITGLTDNELCLKYRLPPIEVPLSGPKPKTTSVSSFKSILSKIRQVSSEHSATTTPVLKRRLTEVSTPKLERRLSGIDQDALPKSGSNAKIKDFFENITTESPLPVRREISRPENNLNSKIIKRFEEAQDSSEDDRRTFPQPLQKSSTGSNIKNLIAFGEQLVSSQASPAPIKKEPQPFSIEKSRSFSKFKDAFETGVGLNEDESSEDEPPTPIKSELKALKSSSRLQSMFRINRSASDAERSPRVNREMDSKTLSMISKSKTAITNMFESQKPKVTFGGAGSSKKPSTESPKQQRKITPQAQQAPADGRKWVFDTIQKYFDVIVEEDQEADEIVNDADDFEALSPKLSNKFDEDDDESDYTSAEEELPEVKPVAKPFEPKLNINPKVDVSKYFQQAKPVYTPTMARKQPQVRCPSTPIDYPAQEKARRKFSLDEFVNDAAKEFDALTDGSDLSLNDERKFTNNSYQNINSLSRSGSSSRIRGLFSSVVHGSANDLNISTFKSNLLSHLKTKKGGFNTGSQNLDPGVADGSDSSEYSEYDD